MNSRTDQLSSRIILCRNGIFDEEVVQAFKSATSTIPQVLEQSAIPQALAAGANGLLLRNSDYSGEIAEAVRAAPQLRWLHFLSSGYDQLETHGGAPDHVRITNSAAALGTAVAEHAVALMLALARNLHIAERLRQSRQWGRSIFRANLTSLDGARVVVVGYGAIGSSVAKLAKMFGADVVIVRQKADATADQFPVLNLEEALPQADFVVLAVPLNSKTHGLIDAASLRLMPPQCRLINISRGPVIETSALVEALTENRLAGAGLDVFDEEPLPENDPLWLLENVILTPHVGGDGNPGVTEKMGAVAAEAFLREN